MINQIIFKMIVGSVAVLLPCLIIIGLVVYGIKKDFFKKSILIILLSIAILGIIYIAVEFSVFFYEIKNEVYVEYNGEYEHSYMPEYSILGANGYRVVLLDKNNYKVCSPDNSYKDGTYNGRVVYTKWSKWVVYMDGELK